MANKMPSLSVTFTSAAAEASTRAESGIVGIILRSGTTAGAAVVRTSADIPAGVSDDEAAYVERALIGSDNAPYKVVVYAGAGDSAIANGLAYFASSACDYLAGPPDLTSAEAKVIGDWVIDQNTNSHGHYRAVLPDYAGNSCWLINFAGAGLTDGETTWTAAEYCSRIAGMLAGLLDTSTMTYQVLSELTDCTRLTETAQDTAVAAGKLIVFYDGRNVRIGTEVNSLTTIGSTQDETWTSIHAVDMMCRIDTDVYQLAVDSYVGKVLNSYDNQCLLLSDVQDLIKGYESDGLLTITTQPYLDIDAKRTYLESEEGGSIDTTDMTDIQVAEYGKHVFIGGGFTFFLGMEQFHFTFKI